MSRMRGSARKLAEANVEISYTNSPKSFRIVGEGFDPFWGNYFNSGSFFIVGQTVASFGEVVLNYT